MAGSTSRRRSEWRTPGDDFRYRSDRRGRPDRARLAQDLAFGNRGDDVRPLCPRRAPGGLLGRLRSEAADERGAGDPRLGATRGEVGMTVRVRVIPCLDVADGRVVKGVNFVDLKDAGDPDEQARAYDAAGADELCFLDISATHEGRGALLDGVSRTAAVCFMPLTVGGGVRSV